ncbi:TetR family transcriptional regulator [Brevibacterium sp. BRM-1]|uniref:TetR/AcrR family transcriptional regulator n=1 Tax=Brevibacterium sp. BRM-1 TaxID=2999062 RepID=UPI0022800EEF|nr:TetR/AcrR family transcriptional regulator [Brevibacterium sp. BRM-1]WAL39932.1 TetR family transcriptional regulator [Brevibacterium sp. BRM-1]
MRNEPPDRGGPAGAGQPTRDRERTRAAIISAAGRLIAERGSGVSLAAIAAEAGVSKGALTHHFPSRAALHAALIEDVGERLWDEVSADVDLSEARPGMLTRAYIRVLASDSEATRAVFFPSSILLSLGSGEFVDAHSAAEAQRWRAAFAADGLPTDLGLALRCAAEGLAANAGSVFLSAEELALTRTRLLALAEAPSPHE